MSVPPDAPMNVKALEERASNVNRPGNAAAVPGLW